MYLINGVFVYIVSRHIFYMSYRLQLTLKEVQWSSHLSMLITRYHMLY